MLGIYTPEPLHAISPPDRVGMHSRGRLARQSAPLLSELVADSELDEHAVCCREARLPGPAPVHGEVAQCSEGYATYKIAHSYEYEL